MITKLSFLATMTLIGSLGVAVAQTRSPAASSGARTPPTPTQVSAQTAEGTIVNGGAAVATGWHFFHIQYCLAFYSGSTFYLYFYPAEGGFWFTSDSHFQGLIEPACPIGNWTGVYVTNSNGTWNDAELFDYK